MSYIETQMFKVAPLPVLEGGNGQFRMKLHSERGETNWLNVTPETFKRIEEALLQQYLDQHSAVGV